MLYLLQGPAGSGKSGLARELLAAGEAELLADTTQLWAAIGGHERGPDGKYPVRSEDDPALRAALYVQATVANFALREGLSVIVTTSRRNQETRWLSMAQQHGQEMTLRTVDPGRDVVAARLADPTTGELSDECRQAIARWYT